MKPRTRFKRLPYHVNVRRNTLNRRAALITKAILLLVLVSPIAVVLMMPVESFYVSSNSMDPTLREGNFVLGMNLSGAMVNFLAKNLHISNPPRRGDVIVFMHPQDQSELFIKRIVGLPGEVVEVKGNSAWVNGKLLAEPWALLDGPQQVGGDDGIILDFGPILVPEKQYFLLGDNRNGSWDGRYFGCVPEGNIVARALAVYWPRRFKKVL